MEKELDAVLDEFLNDEEEKRFNEKVKNDKIKHIKSDFAIIERVDKIVLVENGKQLLREVY